MDNPKDDGIEGAHTKSGLPFTSLVGGQFFGYDFLKIVYAKRKNVVLKARSVTNREDIAIKFLTKFLLDRAPEFEAQLELEVELLQKIQSHRVVPIRDFSYDESFVAYQFVKGRPLATFRKIVPVVAFRLIELICEPLEEIHNLGFAHCDIKPDNLMVVGEKIRLLDFGSVCRIGAGDIGSVSKRHILGTPSYLAPEQLEKTGNYSPAVDVYGLCSTLFCIIVGKRFESSCEIVQNVDKYLSRIPVLRKKLFVELFMKGLARDPNERFQSVSELKEKVRKCRHALENR